MDEPFTQMLGQPQQSIDPSPVPSSSNLDTSKYKSKNPFNLFLKSTQHNTEPVLVPQSHSSESTADRMDVDSDSDDNDSGAKH
jgi:hypothetical protein